jgi:polar amino acid transport system ATP-binding protein
MELSGVTRAFAAGRGLIDVCLTVAAGEAIAICGPSGAGKTTLLRAIVGLERVDAGSIRVGTHEVTAAADLTAVRREVSLVFQDLHLYPHMTARDQVALAPQRALGVPPDEARDHAALLLARVGLEGREGAYPHELSGGERQRVAIARALATGPRALLLDEPTSALDPERTHEVLALIAGLREGGTTLVVVTHELGFARRVASRVAMMDAGRLVEVARVDEFFARPRHPRTAEFLARASHFAMQPARERDA